MVLFYLNKIDLRLRFSAFRIGWPGSFPDPSRCRRTRCRYCFHARSTGWDWFPPVGNREIVL